MPMNNSFQSISKKYYAGTSGKISSNFKPYQGIVENGCNGMLADHSTASWYHSIKSLIDNEALRISLAHQAYENFEENHTLQTQGQRWHDAFVELLEGHA